MKTQHRQILKDMIDIITNINDNALISVDKESFRIRTTDQAYITYLDIRFNPDFFKSGIDTDTADCIVNFTDLKKIFSTSKKKGVVELSFIPSPEREGFTDFVLKYDNKVLNIQTENPDNVNTFGVPGNPSFEYNDDTQRIKCSDLYDDLKTLQKIDSYVHVNTENNNIVFKTFHPSKSDTITAFITCDKSFADKYDSVYDLEHILPVLKILKKYDIYLSLKTDYPLRIQLKELGCEMDFIVAPRIEHD